MFKLFTLLFESKQSIISLGIPEVIASILLEKFGNKAHLLAKWYKDYHDFTKVKNWWKQAHSLSFFRNQGTPQLGDYLEEYKTNQEPELKAQIAEIFFEDIFFTAKNLILDILANKIPDLKPYKDLPFQEANEKYENKLVFRDKQPLTRYSNGWRWLDVGKRCSFLGRKLNNCGSSGIMSLDKDRTMLALFDDHDNPHVVVTYSPNEKRISGDEGVAGTPVKPEYSDYVLDIADKLGVSFDEFRTKSNFLKIKSVLKHSLKTIEALSKVEYGSEYFKLTMNDKRVFYTDSYSAITKEDLKKLLTVLPTTEKKKIKQKNLHGYLSYVFNRYNEPIINEFVPTPHLNTLKQNP